MNTCLYCLGFSVRVIWDYSKLFHFVFFLLSHFLMLCLSNIVSPLEQLSLFSARAKKAEQQFYKQNKQSTHPFDIVLLN